MKSISKSWPFSFLCCESLHRLQVEVIVQMEVVQIFTVDQQHQHVEPLTAQIKSHFYPVHFSELEEFCTSKCSHQASLLLRLWLLFMQFIFDPRFQHFLITDPCLYWISSWTSFFPPPRNQRNIICSSHFATTLVKRMWRPQQGDSIRSIFIP